MDPLFSPATALSWMAVIALLGWLCFRPGKGLLAYWNRVRSMKERVLVEDALKHLFQREYAKRPATLVSLSGSLGIGQDRAARLLKRLIDLGMVRSEPEGYLLEEEGRREAVRLIRAHRLWERYLADETGVEESRWHREAEVREHAMTAEETAALEARLNHPRFDPHGDPIPTPTGYIPPGRGQSLREIAAGQTALVIHVEDEPDEVYAELRAAGVARGATVEVLETGGAAFHCRVNGEGASLSALAVANITVELVPEAAFASGPCARLSTLEPGREAVVVGISPACRGMERRRLMDLGITPGARIVVEMRSPMGDPTAYLVRGALIALRQPTAEQVLVDGSKEALANTARGSNGGGSRA